MYICNCQNNQIILTFVQHYFLFNQINFVKAVCQSKALIKQ